MPSTPTTSPSAPSAPSRTPSTPTSTPTEPEAPTQTVVLRPGDSGAKVRAMQARLRQIGWFHGDVTDYYGSRTTEAVRGFQAKRGFPVTGIADQRTYDRLLSMTRPPTRDELANIDPTPAEPGVSSWDVDQRCLTGRVICISKSTRSLTWVIDGTPQYSMDVRFGNEAQPTREGVFAITFKKVDVVSNIYHTAMPYSMFFSGGQAIHYSADFALNGYNGSSHGCVNVRNLTLLKTLYNTAPVGTTVVVHW
ncbi:MAG TPA: L,D-transpeptidase family protein [Humibacillus xanthopallidus]|nr:L,D-transpeptidase family protein [Humibacillus xanthopallidus]